MNINQEPRKQITDEIQLFYGSDYDMSIARFMHKLNNTLDLLRMSQHTDEGIIVRITHCSSWDDTGADIEISLVGTRAETDAEVAARLEIEAAEVEAEKVRQAVAVEKRVQKKYAEYLKLKKLFEEPK